MPDLDALLDLLEQADLATADHQGTHSGRGVVTTDQVRRALLGGRTLRRPMTSPQGRVARSERLSGFTDSALSREPTEALATVADAARALLGETETTGGDR